MRIETEPKVTISDVILDMTALKEALSDLIYLPNGKLNEIRHIGNLLILMWDFDDYTCCSDATKDDFMHANTSSSIFRLPKPYPKGTVSLPFFILEEEKSKVFEDVDQQILGEYYRFPEVSKHTRIQSLRRSLEAHNYAVHMIDPTKTTEHYCQFSGGGDLCVTKNVKLPLVILSPTDEVDTTALDQGTSGGDMPSSSTAGGGMLSSKLSPLTKGDSKLASLCIEGKKHSPNLDKLKFQLWANMIVIAVKKFKDSLLHFTKEEILGLKQLLGYGMACCGDGNIGVYKLEMRFDQRTMFVTKIELGARERLRAAALMDFTLQYYSGL